MVKSLYLPRPRNLKKPSIMDDDFEEEDDDDEKEVITPKPIDEIEQSELDD
jgi:hypothetical protein